jgi:hypothetical protein
MMHARTTIFAMVVLAASHAFAQAPRPPEAPPAPKAAAAPQAPATPPAPPATAAPATAPAPPPPPPPAPPGPPRRESQPINVKVDLTITEDGGPDPVIRKSITAVVGDGFSGYVREQAVSNRVPVPGEAPPPRVGAPLNLDAYPVILPNGKVRLSCTIQYVTRGPAQDPQRMTTDIKQNLVLILESGKPLVVSQATDPIGERKVTVEVTATVLR